MQAKQRGMDAMRYSYFPTHGMDKIYVKIDLNNLEH